ncbi:MAG TPA: hypothetical protein VMB34_27750 [Acetobacteraceae bacterium]|nr:hypothetical protein [Acetobacteraceae bacterium]
MLCEAVLHGLFSLRGDVQEARFRAAFEAFVAHLVGAGYPSGGRLMRHTSSTGLDGELPPCTYYAAITFRSLEREPACYDYVAQNAELVRTLPPGHDFADQAGIRAVRCHR